MLSHYWSPPSPIVIDERRILNVLAAQQLLNAQRTVRPPRSARVAARWLAGRLDRALIDGADPWFSRARGGRRAGAGRCRGTPRFWPTRT